MRSLFRHNVERMHGYVPGAQPNGDKIIKLNTNENPYPPSPKVMAVIKSVDPETLRKYPNIYWDDFRKAASELHNVKPEQIVCGNGGDEILTMLTRACCEDKRGMAYPTSTYTLYKILSEIQDCQAYEYAFDDYNIIPDALFDSPAGLTILCNPNAPTTTLIDLDQLDKLASKVDGVLLIDEAYADFSDQNAISLLKKHRNIAILRSLSKGYSLAGLRFGYCITSEIIANAMCKVKDSYNLNAITQAAATAAILDQPYFNENVDKIISERTRIIKALTTLGFKVPESHTNFVLAQIDSPKACDIYQKLAQSQIYVRYFTDKRLKDKLRITIGTPDQNNALLTALTAMMPPL
jgi:histidinol-phosphate aminotransferase